MASQVVVELTCAKKAAKTTATLAIPLMQDPAKSATMSVLSSLFLHSFASGQNCINRLVTFILCTYLFLCNYGPSVHTPFVIAGLTNTMVILGDLCGCSR